AGKWTLPTLASTAAAAASAPTLPSPSADWFNVTILNAAGDTSYPISTLTYLLIYKELNTIGTSMTQVKAKALVDFLWWCIHDGQSYSADLAYATLPAALVTLDEGAIRGIDPSLWLVLSTRDRLEPSAAAPLWGLSVRVRDAGDLRTRALVRSPHQSGHRHLPVGARTALDSSPPHLRGRAPRRGALGR